jgi:pimeloyl-ACP methyl ester carboxylesterase
MQVRSDDIQLYYATHGQGFPVVLLHPFTVNHEFWSPVRDKLSAKYRVITPDLRGHGRSGVGDGTATMAKHAEDLRRLIDAEEIKTAVFAGVSIGGYILFEFWRRYRQRVAALVLSNTKAEADTEIARANRLKSIQNSRLHGTAPFLDEQIPNYLGAFTRRNRPDIVQDVRTMMHTLTVDGLTAVQQGMIERPDSVSTLPTIDAKTLVIAGEEDTLTPAPTAQVMRERIPGASLAVIPHAGHYAALENPDEFARVMRQFLNGVQLIS